MLDDATQLIKLDATGDPEVTAAETGRQVKTIEIRLLPHDQVRALLHQTSAHQRSRAARSPENELRRYFLNVELMRSLRWVREGRQAAGEERPQAVVVAHKWSLERRDYEPMWDAFCERLESEGFDVVRFHWRSVLERGTNDFSGAALVWALGTPYQNFGSLAREAATRAWWRAKDGGASFVLPEYAEFDEGDASALASLTQAQCRSRSLADELGRRFLHISSGQLHPIFMQEIVEDGLGARLPDQLTGSLGEGLSLEGFVNAIRERGLTEICAERWPEGIPAPVKLETRQEWCARAGRLFGWAEIEEARPGGGWTRKIWRSRASGSNQARSPNLLIRYDISRSGDLAQKDPLAPEPRDPTAQAHPKPRYKAVRALLGDHLLGLGPELFPPAIAARVAPRTLRSWAKCYARERGWSLQGFKIPRPDVPGERGGHRLTVYAATEADARTAADAHFNRSAP